MLLYFVFENKFNLLLLNVRWKEVPWSRSSIERTIIDSSFVREVSFLVGFFAASQFEIQVIYNSVFMQQGSSIHYFDEISFPSKS